MPDLKATSKRSDARRPEAEHPEHAIFVTGIGRLVRLARAKRGMTRRQLAQESGASERYLAQIESGQGNPSVLILKSIAQALDVPIIELLPRANGRPAVMTHVLDVLARTPVAELPALAELIESHAARHVAADRGRRIALVG
ncbi:MAG TPA: helix-turn-helix domain-containing protein, partial [Xanthobacteraceae bacterium]|nr:helix-turn-helix domain-containing protein [Xanthobacteraceae bacterium]